MSATATYLELAADIVYWMSGTRRRMIQTDVDASHPSTAF